MNLVTYSHVGGIENYNKNIIKSLYNQDIVSVYDKISPIINNNNNFNFNKNKIKSILFILKNIYKYDKLICSHINLLPVLALIKILNPKAKIFLSVHGIEVWRKFSYIAKYFLKQFTIMPVSNYTKITMMEENNFNENIFKVLHNCTSDNINKNFQNKYDENKFNMLSVTRLDSHDAYKGIDSMIKTIPSLIKKIPNLKYTIIGKGNDKKRLTELSKELNVERYIDFKGFVEFIEPYYQYCDIFTLPSKGEGFGIVYIEAMKYSKPCIACDEGGQTDVVINKKTGFLCKYNDVKCLSKKIIDLYNDKEKSEEFGKNGYNHLINNFTFDIFKNRLNRILNHSD